MPLTRAKLKGFTAFDSLDIEFSPGINVLIGENGTGKTHLMKVCYAACDLSKSEKTYIEKLVASFLPSSNNRVRLIKRDSSSNHTSAYVGVFRTFGCRELSIEASIELLNITVTGFPEWLPYPMQCAYIPVKDMLANAPGFRSTYAYRELTFEEIYDDILVRAYLPPLRQKPDAEHERMLSEISKVMGGKVTIKGEWFYLESEKNGLLEFPLLAEGMRKLGLLWLLIQNGTLGDGSVLFWDEPETNLNPSLFGVVIDALLALQRNGVQIFIATHDYVILKELDLRMTDDDQVAFHSLYRDAETGEIVSRTTDQMEHLHPNAIVDTFSGLYNRDVAESIRRFQSLT